jgi:hypothetical protein
MFGMANLRPDETGLDRIVNIYKDEDRRVRHGPRIKVFPGKPHEQNATSIAIPTGSREKPELVGKLTISGRDFAKACAFIKRNYDILVRFWYDSDYSEMDFRRDMK